MDPESDVSIWARPAEACGRVPRRDGHVLRSLVTQAAGERSGPGYLFRRDRSRRRSVRDSALSEDFHAAFAVGSQETIVMGDLGGDGVFRSVDGGTNWATSTSVSIARRSISR